MAVDTYSEAPEIFSETEEHFLSKSKHSPKHSHQYKISLIFLTQLFNFIEIFLGGVLKEKDRFHREVRATGLMPLDICYFSCKCKWSQPN